MVMNSAGTHVQGVDTHAHIVRTDAPLVAERHSAPTRDTGVPELLDLLDKHNLSHAVVTAPSFYGADNSILLDALSRGEGRLVGTVHLDPKVTEDQLAEYAERGVVGMRLNWTARRSRPDTGSADYRRLFRNAAAVGLHVEVLVEPEWLDAVVSPILEEGARLVVDHMGLLGNIDSAPGRRLLAALDDGSTWVKLSAPYRLGGLDRARIVAGALWSRRADRVVWGSDWPWIGHEREGWLYTDTIQWLDDWVPDGQDRGRVLIDNPAKLLGLPQQSSLRGAR
jgi:predicted TIM-barrel fold metal-dependent hydrolase